MRCFVPGTTSAGTAPFNSSLLGGVGSMLAVLIRQHFLCFFPLPHGHGSFRPTLTFDCMKKLLHLVGDLHYIEEGNRETFDNLWLRWFVAFDPAAVRKAVIALGLGGIAGAAIVQSHHEERMMIGGSKWASG
jgi:hypothetical protein